MYAELGWQDVGDEKTKLLRTDVINLMCSSGDDECLSTAAQKFTAWKDESVPIPPNIKSIVYNYGMQSLDSADVWNWMLQRYKDEVDAREKLRLMKGLSCTSNDQILTDFIQLAKDENVVREGDFFTLLRYVADNRVGEPLVWDFVRNEWEYLVERFTLNDRYLGGLIPSITSKFATQERLDEMIAFFEKYPDAGAGEQNRKIALEQVENNIKFVQRYKSVIDQWLVDNVDTGGGGGGGGRLAATVGIVTAVVATSLKMS